MYKYQPNNKPPTLWVDILVRVPTNRYWRKVSLTDEQFDQLTQLMEEWFWEDDKFMIETEDKEIVYTLK